MSIGMDIIKGYIVQELKKKELKNPVGCLITLDFDILGKMLSESENPKIVPTNKTYKDLARDLYDERRIELASNIDRSLSKRNMDCGRLYFSEEYIKKLFFDE